MAPLEWTTTSFGLFSSSPSNSCAMISRSPLGLSRIRQLVTCSQTSRLRSASYVSPLPLFEKFLISTTLPSGVYFRRTSPGMSEKRRYCSVGCQIGPSVKVKPVASRSTCAPSSTSSKMASDLASTPRPVSVLVTVPPFMREMSPPTLIRRGALVTVGEANLEHTRLVAAMHAGQLLDLHRLPVVPSRAFDQTAEHRAQPSA